MLALHPIWAPLRSGVNTLIGNDSGFGSKSRRTLVAVFILKKTPLFVHSIFCKKAISRFSPTAGSRILLRMLFNIASRIRCSMSGGGPDDERMIGVDGGSADDLVGVDDSNSSFVISLSFLGSFNSSSVNNRNVLGTNSIETNWPFSPGLVVGGSF